MIKLDINEGDLQVTVSNRLLHPSMKKYVVKTGAFHNFNPDAMHASFSTAAKFLSRCENPLFVCLRRKTSNMDLDYKLANFVFIWVNGFLTNFDQVRTSMELYNKLKNVDRKDRFDKIRFNKLKKHYESIINDRRPDVLVCSDSMYALPAIREAIQVGIPVIALADSQSDITGITYPVFVSTKQPKSVNHTFNLLLKCLFKPDINLDTLQ